MMLFSWLDAQRAARRRWLHSGQPDVSGNDESSGMLNRKMLFPESVNLVPFQLSSSAHLIHKFITLFCEHLQTCKEFFENKKRKRCNRLGKMVTNANQIRVGITM